MNSEDKKRILELHEQGLSIRKISELVNYSYSTVKRTIDKGIIQEAEKIDDSFDNGSTETPKGVEKFENLELFPDEIERLKELRKEKIRKYGFR